MCVLLFMLLLIVAYSCGWNEQMWSRMLASYSSLARGLHAVHTGPSVRFGCENGSVTGSTGSHFGCCRPFALCSDSCRYSHRDSCRSIIQNRPLSRTFKIKKTWENNRFTIQDSRTILVTSTYRMCSEMKKWRCPVECATEQYKHR